MTNITLYIPGLLSPARDLVEGDIPPTPSLQKLLAIGKRRTFQPMGFSRCLCGLFGLESRPQQDDPVAAITHLVDDRETREYIWMRADPVYLAADREGVVLMDSSTFNLDLQEALVLAADIRDLLAEEGLKLEVPTTDRWYLKLHEPANVTTTPVHEVVAKDIHRFLPSGSGRDHWARLLNEIQMTLHNCPVNEERQQRGELPVNSIWCWGSGSLPTAGNCQWDRVYSDETISKGLSQLYGVSSRESPEEVTDVFSDSGSNEQILTVLSFGLRHAQYHDMIGWQDFIAYLEACWFKGLLGMMRDGMINHLTLLLENQEFSISKSSLLKFWKQQQQLQAYLY